jgi:hypothetical protein
LEIKKEREGEQKSELKLGKKTRKGGHSLMSGHEKSEILTLRIDSELLDYIRRKASEDCRSISQQIAYIIKKEKEIKK